MSILKKNNPNYHLINDFLNALKREKIYGSFAASFDFKDGDSYFSYIRRGDTHHIGCFTINHKPSFTSTLLSRIYKLKYLIKPNVYNEDTNIRFSMLYIRDYFFHYAKDYFKKLEPSTKHSLVFYQFLFGTINVLLMILCLYGLVWYVYGTATLGRIALFVSICSIAFFCKILLTKAAKFF